MKVVSFLRVLFSTGLILCCLTAYVVLSQEVNIGMEIGPTYIIGYKEPGGESFIQDDSLFALNEYFYPGVAACATFLVLNRNLISQV